MRNLWFKMEKSNYNNIRLENRIRGLAGLALAGILSTGISQEPVLFGMRITIFTIDGIGDIIIGEHHYSFSKFYKSIRDKIRLYKGRK